ncbi:hypothetical protein BB561_003995 [Smittium simulii]|uniref:Uncharacterized protein n=1 Tax=Smittium simulii TaxID=133385 RepID=A0A2T9YIJ4_9FUNG|nr:hypothetical protein BB561_003995 [Smittium simulii]
MTLFEGLPSRFRGEESDVDTSEIWMKKFNIVSMLKKWMEQYKPRIMIGRLYFMTVNKNTK